MTMQCQIDSIVVRNGRCFGWGWFLDPAQPVANLALGLSGADDTHAEVACIPGGRREDVGKAHPASAHAVNSGFLILGEVPGLKLPIRKAVMAIELRDGTHGTIDLPAQALFAAGMAPNGAGTPLWSRALAKIRRDGMRAGAILGLGMIRSWLGRAKAWPTRIAYLVSRPRTHLIFDHAMGGGANKFAFDLARDLARDGRPVIRISPVLHELRYQVAMEWRGENHSWIVDDVPALLRMFSTRQALDIHVNELVSFDDPLAVVNWCIARRDAAGSLTYYLHDYFSVCPAWTLVGTDDRFCGVPEMRSCESCLPRNAAKTLGYRGPGIPVWRTAWGKLLARADGIVAFSNASIDILRKAYPGLRDEVVSIRPHAVGPAVKKYLAPTQADGIVVGVAGHISVPKGALMLKEMAAIIRERALPLKILVFGTMDQHDDRDGIEVLGKYAHPELPDLLQRHGVSLGFLPSVCPETFSFVTAEFMAMGVPMAAFPIGAPAERLADYDQGLVFSKVDAQAAVDEIIAFAECGFQRQAR